MASSHELGFQAKYKKKNKLNWLSPFLSTLLLFPPPLLPDYYQNYTLSSLCPDGLYSCKVRVKTNLSLLKMLLLGIMSVMRIVTNTHVTDLSWFSRTPDLTLTMG